MPFIALCFFSLMACATVRHPAGVFGEGRLEIPAPLTDIDVTVVTSPHIAYWNPLFINGKLLITLGGTRSRTTDFAAFAEVATKMGYAVISVDYPNSVITTTCRDNNVTACFDQFREEIAEGDPVSDLVQVNEDNSIQNRILALLRYLAARDTRWLAFLEGEDVNWRKVVVAGHSQGAGHAAYLSKRHAVDRVILFGGPQDHFNNRPAPWLKIKGRTSGDRFRALLHERDFFNTKLQLNVFQQLCGCKDMKNAIVSTREAIDPHNAILLPEYREEWVSMLSVEQP